MSQRKFTMVSPKIWLKMAFYEICDPKSQLLYLYYYTSPHQNITGCCRIPDRYVSEDLGWNISNVKRARINLINKKLIEFDHSTKSILIGSWLEDNKPTNTKHCKGIKSAVDEIEVEEFRKKRLAELEPYIEHFCSEESNNKSTMASNELIESNIVKKYKP